MAIKVMDLPDATSVSWHYGQQTIQSTLDISSVYDTMAVLATPIIRPKEVDEQ